MIVEYFTIKKKAAPSGTALSLSGLFPLFHNHFMGEGFVIDFHRIKINT